MTTWTRAEHSDLGAAMRARGIDLGEMLDGERGFTWDSPTGSTVYAVIAEDGIHVPIIQEEIVCSDIEEAEGVLAKFVRDEFGEVF
jgi:hypothetical protein